MISLIYKNLPLTTDVQTVVAFFHSVTNEFLRPALQLIMNKCIHVDLVRSRRLLIFHTPQRAFSAEQDVAMQ